MALHHLDVPWRPSDLLQREGRIIRQGNENKDVRLFSYVTKGTFDAFMYQTVEAKQRFISQLRTNVVNRSMDDVDAMVLNYAEIKAIATGNPKIKQKMEVDQQVRELELIKQSYLNRKYQLEERIKHYYPNRIAETQAIIEHVKAGVEVIKKNTILSDDGISPFVVKDKTYQNRADAGKALRLAIKEHDSPAPIVFGSYRGLDLELRFDTMLNDHYINLVLEKGVIKVDLGDSDTGNITRIDNAIESFPQRIIKLEEEIESLQENMQAAKQECMKPFEEESKLQESIKLSEQLEREINEELSDSKQLEDNQKDSTQLEQEDDYEF